MRGGFIQNLATDQFRILDTFQNETTSIIFDARRDLFRVLNTKKEELGTVSPTEEGWVLKDAGGEECVKFAKAQKGDSWKITFLKKPKDIDLAVWSTFHLWMIYGKHKDRASATTKMRRALAKPALEKTPRGGREE